MKKPVSFDVYYDGERIYTNLSPEECTEVLQTYSENYYESFSEGRDFDINLITLEETRNGNDERRHLRAGQTEEDSAGKQQTYPSLGNLSEQR